MNNLISNKIVIGTANFGKRYGIRKVKNNNPKKILEPSIGRGDLVEHIKNKLNVEIDMCEKDINIKLLNSINKDDVIYNDFLIQNFAYSSCNVYI